MDLSPRAHRAVNAAPSLELTSVEKLFGDAVALARATLHSRPGTVHALLGENGAGKTTLMRIAFGMTTPDAGVVRVNGASVRMRSPRDAIAAGIGMVHQHFTLVPAMTVAENVALGGETSAARYDARAVEARIREIATRTALHVDPGATAGSLTVGAQQRLEIIKALARNARLLILDEPTAVLTPDEASDLLRWLRAFADAGGSVILITHKLAEALSIADEVTVLRQGRTVTTVPASGATTDALTTAMLGEASSSPSAASARTGRPISPTAIARVENVTLRDALGVVRVRDLTLEVRGGELLGITGVEGSGQRELLAALAGRSAPEGGTLELPRRIAYIPEDRQRDALISDATLTENVALRDAGMRRGRMDWGTMRARTLSVMRDFNVRAASPDVRARTLSGGNQQRLVLGRELQDEPELVVAVNPTRGLDVRATAAIHERLRAARDGGAAVVVYSSDVDEALALADRMLVMHAGAGVELPVDRERVGRAMLGL